MIRVQMLHDNIGQERPYLGSERTNFLSSPSATGRRPNSNDN